MNPPQLDLSNPADVATAFVHVQQQMLAQKDEAAQQLGAAAAQQAAAALQHAQQMQQLQQLVMTQQQQLVAHQQHQQQQQAPRPQTVPPMRSTAATPYGGEVGALDKWAASMVQQFEYHGHAADDDASAKRP